MCDNASVGSGNNPEGEDLSDFTNWLNEDVEVPYPACLNEPLPRKNAITKNPLMNGGSQRSRMFVNSNREHGGKSRSNTSDMKENNSTVPPSNMSWDSPILPETVPKVCLTDNDFAAAVRVKSELTLDGEISTEENSKDNCPHFIIHSRCYCDSTCTVGVCTNCFLVFCNPNCLKEALLRGGKIADVSKTKLDKQPFGFSKQNFSKPFVSEPLSGNDNKKVSNVETITNQREDSSVKANSSISSTKPAANVSNVLNSKDSPEDKRFGETKKKPGRGRGRGAIPFGSETTIIAQPLGSPPKSSSSFRGGNGGKRNTSSNGRQPNAPSSRPTGIFSHSHGFREAYGEIISQSASPYGPPSNICDRYELGGKGHFDTRAGASGNVYRHDEFPLTSTLVVGRSVGRGRGAPRIPETVLLPIGYSTSTEPLPQSGKVLRDPVAKFFGAHSDASKAVPVYRGQSTAQPFTSMSKPLPKPNNPFIKPKNDVKKHMGTKSSKGADDRTVRLHGNIEVKLTKPMKGAYDSCDDSNQRKPFTENNVGTEIDRSQLESAKLNEESVEVKSKMKSMSQSTSGSDDEMQDFRQSRLHTRACGINSELDKESMINQNELKIPGSKVNEDVLGKVSKLWDDMDRIHSAEVEDAFVTATEDHELNGLSSELESLSNGRTKFRRPIDEEMQVPLGVFVIVRPTYIVHANRMYLTWDDTKIVSRNVDLRSLQTIHLDKMKSMKVGDYCVAQYEGDILNNAEKQRAQIVRLADSSHSTIRVKLIDIGSEEEMNPKEIYSLPANFFSQRRLCFRFGLLRYLQIHLDPALNEMQGYLQNTLALNKIGIRIDAFLPAAVDRTRHWGEMFCFEGELNICEDLVDSTCVTECTAKDRLRKFGHHFVMTAQHHEAHTRKQFEVEDAEPVRIPVYLCSGATSFNNFFVIKTTDLDIKADVEEKLDRYASLTLEPFTPWEEGVGDLCLTIVASVKTELFRAQVAYIDQGEAVVRLIDNGCVIKTPVDSLRAMPQALKDIHSLALACSLPVIPVPGKSTYSYEVLSKLDQLNVVLADHQVVAHVLRPITLSKFEVELVIIPKKRLSGGISFSESLVSDGGAMWASKNFRQDVLYPYILGKELPDEESSSDDEFEDA